MRLCVGIDRVDRIDRIDVIDAIETMKPLNAAGIELLNAAGIELLNATGIEPTERCKQLEPLKNFNSSFNVV